MDLPESIKSQINMLYDRKYDADIFNFDMLGGPNVYQVLPYDVVEHIHQYVIDPRNSGNTKKKIDHIDSVLSLYGFRRFAAGTNRAVYGFLEDTRFCLKVSLDKTGMNNNPDEFKNQEYLKPFVCKVFSVSDCGTIATVERVLPIRSRKEFYLNAGSIFDVIANKFVGNYILEDIGTIWFKNWGIRSGFGPVLLDYPYLYEVDLNGLFCNEMTNLGLPCGGQIDYDDGFNILYCTRCGKRHQAKQIGNAISANIIAYKGGNSMEFGIVVKRGDQVIVDKTKSDTHIDPDKLGTKSKYVTERPIYKNAKWKESDFDVILTLNGVKIGKKGDKTTILGESKAKATKLGSKPEDPYAGIKTNISKPRELKRDSNRLKIEVTPDWAKDMGDEQVVVANKPGESVNVSLNMSKFGGNRERVTNMNKETFGLRVVLPESEVYTVKAEEKYAVDTINEEPETPVTETAVEEVAEESVTETNEVVEEPVTETEETVADSNEVEFGIPDDYADNIREITEEERKAVKKKIEDLRIKKRDKIAEAFGFDSSDFTQSSDIEEEEDTPEESEPTSDNNPSDVVDLSEY